MTFGSLHRMRNTLANLCFLGCFALSLFRLETMCLAQEQKVNGQANTSLLIERLEDKDERLVVSAAQALVREGSKIIPSLVEVLQEKKRVSCNL